MLRIYGDFNQVDEEGRIGLGGSPESWSGSRIDDQLREGLRLILDDGDLEAESVLEYEDGEWYARLIPGTGRKTSRKEGQRS